MPRPYSDVFSDFPEILRSRNRDLRITHTFTLSFSTTTFLETAVYIMVVHSSPFDFRVHVLKKTLQEKRHLSKRFYRQRLLLFVYCWTQRSKL